jgi:hypothetical protein
MINSGGLAVTGALAAWLPCMGWACAAIVLAYAALALSAMGFVAFTRRIDMRCAGALYAVFPVLHVRYGLGVLKGISDSIVFTRDPIPKTVGLRVSR